MWSGHYGWTPCLTMNEVTQTYLSRNSQVTLIVITLLFTTLVLAFTTPGVGGQAEPSFEAWGYWNWDAVLPEEEAHLAFIVQNLADHSEEFTFELVEELPDDWEYEFIPDLVELDEDFFSYIELRVLVGERGEPTQGELFNLTVKVVAEESQDSQLLEFQIYILPALPDMSIDYMEIEEREDQEGEFDIYVEVANWGEAGGEGVLSFYEFNGFYSQGFYLDDERFIMPDFEPFATWNISLEVDEEELVEQEWIPEETGIRYVMVQWEEVLPMDIFPYNNHWAELVFLEDEHDERVLDLALITDTIEITQKEDVNSGELTIEVDVENLGNVSASGLVVFEAGLEDDFQEYWLSLGCAWVDLEVGEIVRVNSSQSLCEGWDEYDNVWYSLGAGLSFKEEGADFFPELLIEDWTIFINIAETIPIEDDNKDNNWVEIPYEREETPPLVIDLALENLRYHADRLVAGQNITFSVQVKNLGEAEANGDLIFSIFEGPELGRGDQELTPDANRLVWSDKWQPVAGNYTLVARLEQVGPEADTNVSNNRLVLELTIKPEGLPDPGPTTTTEPKPIRLPSMPWPSGTLGILASVAMVSVVALGSSVLLYQNERSRWWAYTGLAIPLLSRIKKQELEEPDKFKAGQLYQTINLNPGINLTALMALTGMKNGTLMHHLSRLEHDKLIRSGKVGQLRVFYPIAKEKTDEKTTKIQYLRDTQKRVLKVLHKHPESSQKDIADMLELQQQLVSYHLRELLRMGFIRRLGLRRFYTYKLAEGVQERLGDELVA